MEIYDIILFVCLFIIIAAVSFIAGYWTASDDTLSQIDGLWSKDYWGFDGTWIHVNVEDLSFDRMLKVCRHEVSHEMFAQYCDGSDDNFDKCKELVDSGYGDEK